MVWDVFTEVSKELKRKLRKGGECDWTSLVEEVTKDFFHWRGIQVEEALIAKVVETSRKKGCQRFQFLQRGSQRYVRLSEPTHPNRQRQLRETDRPQQLEVDSNYNFSVEMAKFLREGTRPYKDLAAVVECKSLSRVNQLLQSQQLHKDGRCRFERRQLDRREVLWATPNTLDFREAQERREEMMEDMRKFDAIISQRDGKQVVVEDWPMVQAMWRTVCSWLQSEACHKCRLYDFDEIALDCVPGVMTRYFIFDGDAIEVRVHYFKDTSETLIHNHRSSFFSKNLKGSYIHQVWGVSKALSQEHHFATNRSHDPSMESPMQKHQGRLKTTNAHSFCEGDWYFLDHETPHTVRPGGGKALTIYIRSKNPAGDTWVRSTDQTLPDQSRTPDTRIEGAEDKMAFLEEIWQLLQPASWQHAKAARWKRHGTRPAA